MKAYCVSRSRDSNARNDQRGRGEKKGGEKKKRSSTAISITTLTNDPLGSAPPILPDLTREYRSSSSEDWCGPEAPGSFEYQNRFPANASRRSGAASGRSHASLYRSNVRLRLPRAESPSRGCDDACVCRSRAPRTLAPPEIRTASSSPDRHSAFYAREPLAVVLP